MKNEQKQSFSFQTELKDEVTKFVKEQVQRFPENEVIKIDLHCHDKNSDVPDELLGRILNVPETWLSTKRLIKTLNKNKVDAITVTNHNNARSCFELQELGQDVLVGAEFSVNVPDYEVGIHVLTYGFSKEQEKILNKLRKNIYQFLQFTCENNIPTIWAHPLYHYKSKGIPPFDFFSKMALIFERFEVINGQRDTWQNMLVKIWLENLTPEQIDTDAKKFDIDINLYCKNRYKKSFSGGSDSHMGIFSGQTGTYLHIPNLQKRIKNTPASVLALEAIRNGDMAPYGSHQNSERLSVAFLDYVCQIAMYKQDPGLLRILLHKGTANNKILALVISNAFAEIKRHRVTMNFIELFHKSFLGKAPKKTTRLIIPKTYKPIFDEARNIAKAHDADTEEMTRQLYSSINEIHNQLNSLLFKRINKKLKKIGKTDTLKNTSADEWISKLEVSSYLRSFVEGNYKKDKTKSKKNSDIANFLDGLPFPFLVSTLILAANFTSAKVMYNNRKLLSTFSKKIGKLEHPKRTLWLTDTFEDKNGVSSVLQQWHKEIKAQNLPIDILVCSKNVKPDAHLIVAEPMVEIDLPYYKQQPVRVPDFNKIHHLFLENEYDRIVCSTEGIMGLMALYLKNAYSVPTYFYMHTDWIMFARKVLNLDSSNISRVRRVLRAYYGGFDKLFVLNNDHKQWLIGKEMGFKEENVHLTAHWVDEDCKKIVTADKQTTFGLQNNEKVLLFAGRLSAEKGVFDIVDIYPELKAQVSNLKLVFAGTGPAEKELKKALPNALFLGWVNPKKLPELYSAADLLILPSKFDTFSCVVLEALSCELPVVAYNSKGPKDILKNQNCGMLATGKNEMIKQIIDFFKNEKTVQNLKEQTIKRARAYDKKAIIEQFLNDIEILN